MAGYQINIYQLYSHTLVMNNPEVKIIPFIIAVKGIKYLGVNLGKEVQDLYLENIVDGS